MGIGFLTIQARTGDDILPVANAKVIIKRPDGPMLYETVTNANGNTESFALTAPNMALTLDPSYTQPAYSICDVEISSTGFVTTFIRDIEIVDTQTSILPISMRPVAIGSETRSRSIIIIPPKSLLQSKPDEQAGPPDVPLPEGRVLSDVVIPDYITVHLGRPDNATARNIRVKFSEYIKNVVSSEIYSTWPQSSLVANIHAIVTYALNRIYSEWYRSRGYNFDITNSTAFDQSYREGGPIFENISRIVDGIFNVYARKIGFGNPFFTQFCNGTTVTCAGLSQWGTVALANQGMTPIQILHNYYPKDLELVLSNNVTPIPISYPGTPLRLGSRGDAVRRMQNYLNRIRVNFPLIPRISNPNGVFDEQTLEAARVFQQTFNLTPDGIIGRETWNKISSIYVSVIRLGELESEGERIGIGITPPNEVLKQGSRGEHVIQLQFILDAVSHYYNSVPSVIKDGVFDSHTKNAVIEFQKTFGLASDGVVGPATWNKLYEIYRSIEDSATPPPTQITPPPNTPEYPGTLLKVGSSGQSVWLMQTFLNEISIAYPSIPQIGVDGIFGEQTRSAVIAFQREFMLSPDGIIGPTTWEKIIQQNAIVSGDAVISNLIV